MKKFNLAFILILFALTALTSCQDEVVEITDPSSEQTIVAGSSLATNMMRTATLDGSWDNIIDGANCLSVELPVTVIVNGLEVVIDSEDDYGIIEAVFEEFGDDEDVLEIQFPIVIILSDYTEITIESYEELEAFVVECPGENETDDDIECIDFIYPITISVYNTDFQIIDTVTIESDEQLYVFIDGLDGGVLASINFPISMVMYTGQEIVVNNNAQLEAAIDNADDSCDEDDDYDYGDDNGNDIPSDYFSELLTGCSWIVDKLERGENNDLENLYVGYVFYFYMSGTVVVEANGNDYMGTWALAGTDNIQVNLNLPDWPDFNNEHWILHEVEEDGNELDLDFRNGEDRLRFERFECDIQSTDCTEQDVDSYLQNCVWNVVNFNGDDHLVEFELDFMLNQQLVVTGVDINLQGTWSTSQSASGGVEVVIDGFTDPNIQDINGSWEVTECTSDKLEMTMGNNMMIMEQNCATCGNPGALTNDLIIYMPFSNEAKDLISGQTLANITNDFVLDRSGNSTCAIAFNGNNHVSIPVTPQNQLVQGDNFSVSLWFKMQNTNIGNLEVMFQKGETSTEGFQLAVYDLNTPLVSDTTYGYGLWDNDWNQETDLVWDNTDWHHFVLTRDANNTIRVYRDGVLRNIDENSNFDIDSAPLSSYLIGQFFEGHLDDLRVYKRTLSDNEVGDLYNLEGDCYQCL